MTTEENLQIKKLITFSKTSKEKKVITQLRLEK